MTSKSGDTRATWSVFGGLDWVWWWIPPPPPFFHLPSPNLRGTNFALPLSRTLLSLTSSYRHPLAK